MKINSIVSRTRTAPPGSVGHVVRRLAEFGTGVGHRHPEAHRPDDRQIGQVVADVAHLVGREPQLARIPRMAVSLLSIPWRMISIPNSATRIFTMFELRWVISPKR